MTRQLFVTRGHDRIYAHRSAGRKTAGNERDSEQHGQRAGDRDGIERRHADQL
jgi:hypothetical protein